MVDSISPTGACCGRDTSLCVAQRSRVVLMGDSTMRSQYLDLTYGLHDLHDDHMTTRRAMLEGKFDCPPNPEGGGTWASFLRRTELLPHGWCDCYHSVHNMGMSCENRHFSPPLCHQVSIDYYMAKGGADILGHAPDEGWTNTSSRVLKTSDVWSRSASMRWSLSWEDTIAKHVAPLRPAVLVLGAGLWPTKLSSKAPSIWRILKRNLDFVAA